MVSATFSPPANASVQRPVAGASYDQVSTYVRPEGALVRVAVSGSTRGRADKPLRADTKVVAGALSSAPLWQGGAPSMVATERRCDARLQPPEGAAAERAAPEQSQRVYESLSAP